MNKVILMGRLTKDPDVRRTSTGKVVTSFSLAVDRPFKGQDGKKEVDFINCQLWGKLGEAFGNYMAKGQRALVEGRLQIHQYKGKDGSTKWLTEIVCSGFEFVETKGSAGQDCTAQAPASNSMSSFGYEIDPEGIPF